MNKIILGNIKAKRDWGFAADYVESMWLMLQQNKPDDFVISTGESHSVEEFLDSSFEYAGLGKWDKYVEISEKFKRPYDIDHLVGDYSKAKNWLNWAPTTTYDDLVKLMVDSDLKLETKKA